MLRKIFRGMASVIATALIVPFIQTPASKLAETVGFDRQLSNQWRPFVAFLYNLQHNLVYVFIAGSAVGLACGFWIDSIIKKKEEILAWNEKSHLRLVFDSDLQFSSPIIQEGVEYFYWYHIPSVAVDYNLKQTITQIGYIVLFISLKFPTYTNNNRINVVGGGVTCEMVAHHASAAVFRLWGDVRGRTIDIQIGKDPIPLS